MKRTKVTTRQFEMAMGLIGSVAGILSGSFFIFLFNNGHVHATFLGLLAILGSLIGVISSAYVFKNNEAAGIGFIVASMFVILGTDHINAISAVFLIIAGISALFRK